MPIKKMVDSFNHAIEGIIYSVRTQRNMKIHMFVAVLVLIGCFVYDLSKFELLVLSITVALVLFAEMINTAVESAIDATTNYYHPLAKIAKNVAAGAVLITAVNAVIVGYILFGDRLNEFTYTIIGKIKHSDPYMVFIILVLVTIVTIIVKAFFGEGTPLKGGMPSGHSALSFSIATIISLLSPQSIVVILSYLLSSIVAQSRVDAEIHSIWEVIVGAIFGTLLTVLIYGIFM